MRATTLERTLGVSHRTAWTMLHCFRVAMVRSKRPEPHGPVEVDEAFVGGVRHRHIPASPRQEFVVPFVVDTVEPGALLLTAGARLYDPLTSRGYGCQAVSMATAEGAAHEYLPGVPVLQNLPRPDVHFFDATTYPLGHPGLAVPAQG